MRQHRSDSTTAAVVATQLAAAGPIEPPPHVRLRDGDRPFWDSIVRARAKATWNDSDLEVAASMARAKADIERIQSEIDAEGDVVTNERGTQIINPKHTLIETLTRRVMAGSRMLHIHAEATQGESREQKGKLAKQREAEKATAAARGDDDLIPGVSAQH
jgi:hypothetical protein